MMGQKTWDDVKANFDGFVPDLLNNLVWWTNATKTARDADAASGHQGRLSHFRGSSSFSSLGTRSDAPLSRRSFFVVQSACQRPRDLVHCANAAVACICPVECTSV